MKDDDGPYARPLTRTYSPKKESSIQQQPAISVSIPVNAPLFLPF
jgi:hypothetical protein